MTPIEKARNLGPVSGGELRSIGIETLEGLVEMGWEDAFERWVMSYPERINLNACTALIGATEDIDWRYIGPGLKAEAKLLVRKFRGQHSWD